MHPRHRVQQAPGGIDAYLKPELYRDRPTMPMLTATVRGLMWCRMVASIPDMLKSIMNRAAHALIIRPLLTMSYS